ncbi:hypothetical protein acdb102_15870 [Acidothermaceae bacterium B102]|nr:hypothetical protein acdb102_15870 [Acidothermaceae bacterium B102]
MAFRAAVDPDLLRTLPKKRYRQQIDMQTGEVSEYQTSGDQTLKVHRGNVQIHADRRTGRPEMRLEFSAPSVLRGHNVRALGLSAIEELVSLVLDALAPELSYVPDIAELSPVRVDLARNFQIQSASSDLLEAFYRVKPTRARIDRLERGRTGAAQTLTRGSVARWLTRGYDKGEQLHDVALYRANAWRREELLALAEEARGVLRWEMQLHGGLLRERGIRSVADMKPEILHGLAKEYFTRSRFDSTLAGPTRLREVLQTLVEQNRPADARNLGSLLLAEALGSPTPMSLSSRKKARSLARTYGLSAADILAPDGASRRLDLEQGVEVIDPFLLSPAIPTPLVR